MRQALRRLLRRTSRSGPINFYYTRSANYAAVQRELFGLIGMHLGDVDLSETRGQPRPDATNLVLHIRRKNRRGRVRTLPAEVVMSHGVADKRYLFLRHPDTGKPFLNGFEHVLVPGPWIKRALLDTDWIELGEGQIHVVGWPRLDLLVTAAGTAAPRDSRLRVLWAPSHDFVRRGQGQVTLSSYPAFAPYAKRLEQRFDVRVSLHPRNRDDKAPTQAGTLTWADVVISDFGTMLYEAWALGRPVIFPRWIVGEAIERYGKGSAEQYIHLERIGWHPESFDELVDMLDASLDVGPGVEEFMDDYLPARYLGCSGQRCAEVLRKISRAR